MPQPPTVGIFTRYVLENPYPLAIVLIVAALAMAWIGLSDGRKQPLKAAGLCIALAVGVFITSMAVTTPGEHGEDVALQLVNHVVAGDTNTAMAMFAPHAAFTIGSPRNAGLGIDFIHDRLSSLNGAYTITSNRVTSLRGYGDGRDAAEVHLSCRTEVSAGYGPTPSQWVLRVERDEDGNWAITQLTAVSIAGRTPGSRLW